MRCKLQRAPRVVLPPPRGGGWGRGAGRARTGTRNASVLPEPVLAAPRISRPASACGMAARCMAVSCLYLACCSPPCVAADSGSSENALAAAYPPLLLVGPGDVPATLAPAGR